MLVAAASRDSIGKYRGTYLDSQVARNNRPLYPKVDHHWFEVARNYEPLALQVYWIVHDFRTVEAHRPTGHRFLEEARRSDAKKADPQRSRQSLTLRVQRT